MKKGYFISFEGMDGSGKSTQIEILERALRDAGHQVVITREPGGTAIGEQIRDILLKPENDDMSDMTEALLYAASRAQHVKQVIKPALETGKTVICDRFLDSSIAYQGYGRALGDAIPEINRYAVADCLPDITFLMKVSPETGDERIGSREKDRIELETEEFRMRVYHGYEQLEIEAGGRIVGIDASQDIEKISQDIISRIKALLADSDI